MAADVPLPTRRNVDVEEIETRSALTMLSVSAVARGASPSNMWICFVFVDLSFCGLLHVLHQFMMMLMTYNMCSVFLPIPFD